MGETFFDRAPASDKGTVNMVLVGKTGNGKSATGNSILRRRAFVSKHTFEAVTTKCQQQNTTFEGRTLNLIDTPGLFVSSHDSNLEEEIARCVSMAEGGIHAVLVVVSLGQRFSSEEGAVVETLLNIFGSKISDYMIVVFTHGDVLEVDENPIARLPDSLKELLKTCGNRHVTFDNKTKDEGKKYEQMKQLLKLVNGISNGFGPYTNDSLLEYQSLASEKLAAEWGLSDEPDYFSEYTLRLELASTTEKAAKFKEEKKRAEEYFKYAGKRFDEEIHELKRRLHNAGDNVRCSIM